MKKIIWLLAFILISTRQASAKGFDFFSGLKNKPTAQDRLAPVKQTYDDAMTPSEQAIVLYNDNNLTAAMETLLSIKENDRIAQDYLLLGNILQDQEKNVDAIFMYQRAILKDPKFYKAYYNLGNIYLADDKPFLAIENYRETNKLNNEFAYGYYNLGCAYLKAGNLNKAKIAFIKAVELKNNVPDFYYNLAYTYKMLKKPKIAKQYLDLYNKLMENNQ
jgi:tetratricopeptide (TPR) repeat protein